MGRRRVKNDRAVVMSERTAVGPIIGDREGSCRRGLEGVAAADRDVAVDIDVRVGGSNGAIADTREREVTSYFKSLLRPHDNAIERPNIKDIVHGIMGDIPHDASDGVDGSPIAAGIAVTAGAAVIDDTVGPAAGEYHVIG